jgi:hypothetical protein
MAAVKLDPNSAQYHVTLAVLYRDLGFGKGPRRKWTERCRSTLRTQARQLQASLEK